MDLNNRGNGMQGSFQIEYFISLYYFAHQRHSGAASNRKAKKNNLYNINMQVQKIRYLYQETVPENTWLVGRARRRRCVCACGVLFVFKRLFSCPTRRSTYVGEDCCCCCCCCCEVPAAAAEAANAACSELLLWLLLWCWWTPAAAAYVMAVEVATEEEVSGEVTCWLPTTGLASNALPGVGGAPAKLTLGWPGDCPINAAWAWACCWAAFAIITLWCEAASAAAAAKG